MAKRFAFHALPLITTIIFLAMTVTRSESYSKTTPFHGVHNPQKLTHLHFYFHDVITGAKPTAIRVAAPPGTNSSSVPFGVVMVADDPLTEGPDPNSKKIGSAQGMYTSSDMDIISFTMVFNFVFTQGEFKGSTVAMYGRNAIMSKVREMPIIGGTGAFRFARGYAQAKTNKLVGLNAVVEYNVFIWH